MMKKALVLSFLVCFLGVCYVNRYNIADWFLKNYFDNKTATLDEPNEYYKDYDYNFVQNTENLYPYNRQDILNIIYTSLNRGLNDVTFYCGDGYDNCIDDVNDIAENNTYLSTINNLVHPFNSYSKIHFTITTYGKVTISITRNYDDDEIALVNRRIDDIVSSIITDDMSLYNRILTFHDYIINNTEYDSSVSIDNQLESGTKSNNAFGLLFNNKAICSGYSDVMAIFLNKYGLNNYKISSDEHIWNLVNIDGKWLHIDATWDDPVTANGNNVLLHDFFLIDTSTLFDKENVYEKNSHSFDRSLYSECN